MNEANKVLSDVEWYCRQDPEAERFYNIFFKLCRKYNISWTSADEKEKAFIEEVTRVFRAMGFEYVDVHF